MKFAIQPYLTPELAKFALDVVTARVAEGDRTYTREAVDQDAFNRRVDQTALAKIPEIIAAKVWGGNPGMGIDVKAKNSFDLQGTSFHGRDRIHIKTCVTGFDQPGSDHSWMLNRYSNLAKHYVNEVILLAGQTDDYVRFVGWIDMSQKGIQIGMPEKKKYEATKRAIWESMNRDFIQYF